MAMTMDTTRDETARHAAMFKALGDPTRLRIWLFLRSACCPVAIGEGGAVQPVDGPTVGQVCCHVAGVERVTSTLSHHLKELRHAGLITMERRGRHIVCGVDRQAAAELAALLNVPEEGEGDGCCE